MGTPGEGATTGSRGPRKVVSGMWGSLKPRERGLPGISLLGGGGEKADVSQNDGLQVGKIPDYTHRGDK